MVAAPTSPNPPIIIAQVAGSGTTPPSKVTSLTNAQPPKSWNSCTLWELPVRLRPVRLIQPIEPGAAR